MPALPTVGADTGVWGSELNSYLLVGHDTAGRHTLQQVNAKEYGAVGDSVTDDTAALQAGLTAAAGGIFFIPPGTYKTSATLSQANDNTIVRGAGWGTIIKPATGALFDVFSTPIPASAGLSGYVRNYIGIEDLQIDCSNMTGTTAGQGNAVHWYGVRYSRLSRLLIVSCKNWAILLDGDNTGPGNNFGYDNLVRDCIFDLCNANVYQTNCEANDYINNRFKWCGGTTSATQPVFGTVDTVGMHLRLGSGYAYVAGNVFGKGGTYTTPAIRCENSGPCRIIGNRFDQVRNQAVVLNAGNHEFAFNALGSPGSAISGVPGIQLGSSKNRVVGNSFDTTAGGSNFTYAVAESGGPFTDNIIADNELLAGTAGVISLNATSTAKVHHNGGYNPVGHAVTQPAVPASTVAATNNSGVDCMVFVAGGTVTAIAISGSATGLTSGAFRVPAGASIAITYSVAPTWQWFGD